MEKFRIDHFEDISFPDPAENILYDDVLLALAEQGAIGNTLRLWESPKHFIVLGRTGKAEDDLLLDAIKKQGIPVLRRSSGGGTVVQGPGCLNFSFVLSKERYPQLGDLRRSYQLILDGILRVLKLAGIEAAFRPTSDLALTASERKFSGNAQKRGRKFILHHGTILYDLDLALVKGLLAMPKDIPEYRKGRPHADFVANVPLKVERFKALLLQQFSSGVEKWQAEISVEARGVLARYLVEKKPQLEV